jgi:hypothetical protein
MGLAGDWFRRLAGKAKRARSKELMSQLAELEDQLAKAPEAPERQLEDDEDLRICRDPETGSVRTEVVKKSAPLGVEPPQYPEAPPVRIHAVKTLPLHAGGQSLELSLHYRAVEPEDDDVVASVSPTGKHLVHARRFFMALLDGENRFVSDLSEADRGSLSSAPCLSVKFMDDSRDYFDVVVSGTSISVPGHYLGLKFHIFSRDDEVFMLTEHLVNDDGNSVPLVHTVLDIDVFMRSSAAYDEDAGGWVDIAEREDESGQGHAVGQAK